jgi:hypothetical protein
LGRRPRTSRERLIFAGAFTVIVSFITLLLFYRKLGEPLTIKTFQSVYQQISFSSMLILQDVVEWLAIKNNIWDNTWRKFEKESRWGDFLTG